MNISNKNNKLFSQMIQKINISADMNRSRIFELGHRAPYYRFTNFPVNLTEEVKLSNSILITGGDSMLGQHTRNSLDNKYKYHYTSHRSINLIDMTSVRFAFHDAKPDYVINYAGFNGNIQFSQKYPADIFFNTTQIALNVLRACHEYKVKKVINILSSCALPPDGDNSLKAESLHNGPPHESIAAHGYAKRVWNIYGQQLYKQHGLLSVCVILNNCFGEYDNTDVDKTKAVMGIIKKIVDAKRNNLPEVVCWGSGYVYREFLYAKDAATCVLQALENYNDPLVPLNISDPNNEMTIKELTNKIVDIVGYEGKIVWDTTKQDGQKRKSLDISNMNKYINIEFTPFDLALRQTIEWYINESNKDK